MKRIAFIILSMVVVSLLGAPVQAQNVPPSILPAPIAVKGLSPMSLTNTTVSIEWLADREGIMNIQYDVQNPVRESASVVAGKRIGMRDGYMVYQANIGGLQSETTYYYQLLVDDPTTSSGWRIVNADFNYLSRFATLSNERDLTKRISYWWGKVNQHIENGVWKTDPDGTSGANLDKLAYCQKWYPGTTSVADYRFETIFDWKAAGNTGGYVGTHMTYQCLAGTSGTPDLVISDFSWLPVEPKTTDLDPYLYVDLTVKNIGTAPVSLNGVSYGVYFGVNGIFVGEVTAEKNQPTLDPGQSYTYRRATTMQDSEVKKRSGSFMLAVKADSKNVVVESNEDNNVLTKLIVIGGGSGEKKPDLIVDSMGLKLGQHQDSGGNMYRSIDFEFCTKNIGKADVGHNQFMMKFVFNGTVFEEQYPGGWSNVGDSYCGGIIYDRDQAHPFVHGSNTIRAMIDSNDQIDELLEDNNALTKTFDLNLNEVQRKPDFIVEKIVIRQNTDTDPSPAIVVRFKNQGGEAPALMLSATVVDQDTNMVYSQSQGGGVFPADSTGEIQMAQLLKLNKNGKYRLKAVIDSDQAFNESNELNNTREEKVELKKTKDVEVVSFDRVAGVYQVGAATTFKIVYRNNGGEALKTIRSIGSIKRIDHNSTIPEREINLKPRSNMEEEFTVTFLEPGEQGMKVMIDSPNAIDEYSESNNYKKTEFSVAGESDPTLPPVVDTPPAMSTHQNSIKANDQLVKEDGKSEIYVIRDGKRQHVPSLKMLLTHFRTNQIKKVSRVELERYQAASFVGFDPADADEDGLALEQEQKYHTNPNMADSDGDGYLDGEEVVNGYNPMGKGRL